jgi:hypothetical protein
MSIFKTLSKGYKGGPSQPKTKNIKKSKPIPKNKTIDPKEVGEQIKKWYSEGRITLEGLQSITTQLQKIHSPQTTPQEDFPTKNN